MPLSYSNSVELHRSSHRRCSKKKGVLKYFAKFKGKHLCQSLFFYTNCTNFFRSPILEKSLLLVAVWRTTQKLRWRDLLLLTCLVCINVSVASSFYFFYVLFLIHICFGFDKTNPTKGKSYGKHLWMSLARRVLQQDKCFFETSAAISCKKKK